MLATLKYSPSKLCSQLSHEFSGSNLIDSFYLQDVEKDLITLLQDRPVVGLSLPNDNHCSIPYWIADEREPIKIPPSAPAKLSVNSEKVQAGEKIQAIADPSARAQAIARMTRILSIDRAITRTVPMREAPAKVTA